MKVLNLANDHRYVYVFTRNDKGEQEIIKDTSFYPFFYEKDASGEFVGYDNSKLKKIVCNSPNEIPKMRSLTSYSSDVRYLVNYSVHKIDEFEKTHIKYFFIDIEILTPELPDLKNPKYPVSCITVYDSSIKGYVTFFLNDYPGRTPEAKEKHLLEEFMAYMRVSAPDIWLSWNVNFDYQYLHNRIPNFAKKISPIEKLRISKEKDIYYPAGISILDYLTMFKKVNMRESSMKLDNIAEKHLGKGKVHKEVDFTIIDEKLRERNREDVELLVKLEEKFRIIEYFDEIRRFSKCMWEDLTHNSLVLDSVVLNEARKRNVVLPSKMESEAREEEELVGAYRRSDAGVYFDIYKADVASMYPNQLVNFCLDPANMSEEETENSIKIQDTYFKQDRNAILPKLAVDLMNIKDDLKAQLKKCKHESEESKVLQMKYDAYKGLVNSLFGVTAFPSFRLYNNSVASAITFLARDLLHFVEDDMLARGHKVVAVDTDALMYESDKDEIDHLNNLVQQWAKKYNKDKVDIRFESEGMFTKLLILGRCVADNSLIVSNDGSVSEIKEEQSSVFLSSGVKLKVSKEVDTIYNIHTTDGIISCTSEHTNLIIKNRKNYSENNVLEKQTKDILIGDYLLKLKKIPHVTKKEWTKEQLAFIAMIIADGHLEKYSVECKWHKRKSYNVAKTIAQEALNSFVVKPTSFTFDDKNLRVRIFGKDFSDYISKTFSITKNCKRYSTTINNEIFLSSLDSIESFINTILFFEGYYHNITQKKYVQMVSFDFINRFSLLLKKFSIDSTIIKLKKVNGNYRYRLSIKTKKRNVFSYKKQDITLSKVLKIEKESGKFNVYDLMTNSAIFNCNGFITHNCHYYGYIKSEKGIKREIKGVEVKRSSSSKYESYFQENLIEKVLDKKDKNEISKWIASEKDRIRTLPITDVAFPCKMTNKKYVNLPIFKRAYNNTRNFVENFDLHAGDSFYYVYVNSLGKDSNNKDINVLAFTSERNEFIDRGRIDWSEHIRRNIDMKTQTIFEAIGWKMNETVGSFQLQELF